MLILHTEKDVMSEVFQNKVAESGIITLDLEQYYPKGEPMVFDMKDHLFMGLILKEKDFREALKNTDWELYRDKNVAVTCSADAIIPVWAYMLVSAYLQPVAAAVLFGTKEQTQLQLLLNNIAAINTEAFTDKRVVIKGCGEIPISEAAYLQVTNRLRPVAKSIMYGEPCSTVPIYKKK
jgi:ABC-type transport system involved in cytochrome bd biosynthesis fused ATPase/permease subunit